MALQPGPIVPLPPESQAQIRSSVVITSLNDVVIGLLENVLDAGASWAGIRLDYIKGYCAITDDGIGIPVAEFGPNGQLGSLHCTSKLDPTRPTYGRYGRFLYHLAALSLLSITSKHGSSPSTITLHRAKIIASSEGKGEYAELISGHHGTHAVVANLFGDIPVRYRHIATRLQSAPQAEAEFNLLRKRITALVLSCGRAIDIQVVDARTKRAYKHKTNALERRSSFELSTIASALQQAGYIECSQSASFKLVSVQTPSIRIRAAVSLHAAPAKDVQFISIGIRPMNTSASACPFQDEINAIFEQSSFGTVEDAIDIPDEKNERRRKDRRFASDTRTNRQLNSHKKAVDRWPMFFIRIDPQDSHSSTAPDHEQSKSGLAEKWIKKVLDLLRSMFYEFLSVHHFRPRKRRRLEKTSLNRAAQVESHLSAASSLANSARILPSRTAPEPLSGPTHFNAWSRVKTGISAAKPRQISSAFDQQADPAITGDESRSQTSAERVQLAQNAVGEMELQALDEEDLGLLVGEYHDEERQNDDARRPNRAAGCDQHSDTNAASLTFLDEASYLWTDPATGIEHKINARNGFIVPRVNMPGTEQPTAAQSNLTQRPTAAPANIKIAQRIRGRPTKKSPAELIASLQQSDLIRSFCPIEALIPSIVTDELDDMATLHPSHDCVRSSRKTSQYFSIPANVQSLNLSKIDLESARVIAQVDQKFILVQTQPTTYSNPLLVLIDQHAADERVKVEELYSQLCSCATTTLMKPIIFEVPRKEIELFAQHQQHFAEWQIIYNIKHRGPGTESPKQIVVTALPSLISERCRLDPKLLNDLLRRGVHKTLPKVSSYNSASNWIHRIPHCPAGLVGMVNSRACRSAIMFNDVLDNAQCEELVRRLVKCILPFQCAHGRPSCVVLPGWASEGRVEKEGVSFAEKFREWQNGIR